MSYKSQQEESSPTVGVRTIVPSTVRYQVLGFGISIFICNDGRLVIRAQKAEGLSGVRNRCNKQLAPLHRSQTCHSICVTPVARASAVNLSPMVSEQPKFYLLKVINEGESMKVSDKRYSQLQ